MRRFLAIVGVATALSVPMGSALATGVTVHESGSVNVAHCDVTYDSGTYTWSSIPYGSISVSGPSAGRDC